MVILARKWTRRVTCCGCRKDETIRESDLSVSSSAPELHFTCPECGVENNVTGRWPGIQGKLFSQAGIKAPVEESNAEA
jgi:hypothetical protein